MINARTILRVAMAMLAGGLLVWAQSLPSDNAVALSAPNGLAIDEQGRLYISDIETHCIYRLGKDNKLEIVAGTGAAGFSGDDGLAVKAQLNAPHDLLFDAAGNLLVADSANHRIRRIDRRGVITTIAGDGQPGGRASYNDPAPEKSLNYPQSIVFDSQGNLLIADTFNHVVRKLDAQNRLSIFAGSVPGYGGDGGSATKAQISLPMAVTVAKDGSVYLADGGSSRIRRVSADRIINTVAGYGPAQDTYGGGFAGEGVPLAKAKLFTVTDLKFDLAGNLYVVDSGNARVRVVREGIITTLAGNGEHGLSRDGATALQASFQAPQKIAIAKDGTIYLSDRSNHCIRVIERDGKVHQLAVRR